MPVSISGDGTLTGVSITTADLANSSVTVAKISATGTPSSTTFLAGDGSWQTTTPTTAQVLSATAGASVGAVGTYAQCSTTNASQYVPGATIAGSSLRYTQPVNFGGAQCGTYYASTTGGEPRYNSNIPAGTWRCMGYISGGALQATMWLRIS